MITMLPHETIRIFGVFDIFFIIGFCAAAGHSFKAIDAVQSHGSVKVSRDSRMLAQSRAGAAHNDVEATPAFFINNRRYRSFKDARWIIDAARFRASATTQMNSTRRRIELSPWQATGKDGW